MSIRITTLIENTGSEHKSLLCEHGLSFHVKTKRHSFLFDCGASANLLHNAEKLNIPLAEISFVVGSHGHYDHGGGFRHVIANSNVRRLITGQGYLEPKYRVEGMKQTYLGVDFDRDFLEANSIQHETCGDLLALDDDCWLVGNFERSTKGEDIPGYFMLRQGEKLVPDLFNEEICLAIRMEDGLAVLVGCSHPGIQNMVKTVEKRLRLPIRGIWGGTHLSNASPGRIATTLSELKASGVKYFGLSHCSGERILEAVNQDPDLSGCRLCCGDGVVIAS